MVTYSKSQARHDKKRTEMDSEMDVRKHTLDARNCVLKQIVTHLHVVWIRCVLLALLACVLRRAVVNALRIQFSHASQYRFGCARLRIGCPVRLRRRAVVGAVAGQT